MIEMNCDKICIYLPQIHRYFLILIPTDFIIRLGELKSVNLWPSVFN